MGMPTSRAVTARGVHGHRIRDERTDTEGGRAP